MASESGDRGGSPVSEDSSSSEDWFEPEDLDEDTLSAFSQTQGVSSALSTPAKAIEHGTDDEEFGDAEPRPFQDRAPLALVSSDPSGIEGSLFHSKARKSQPELKERPHPSQEHNNGFIRTSDQRTADSTSPPRSSGVTGGIDPRRRVVDKDTGEEYDIDDLPDSMLKSIARIKKQSSDGVSGVEETIVISNESMIVRDKEEIQRMASDDRGLFAVGDTALSKRRSLSSEEDESSYQRTSGVDGSSDGGGRRRRESHPKRQSKIVLSDETLIQEEIHDDKSNQHHSEHKMDDPSSSKTTDLSFEALKPTGSRVRVKGAHKCKELDWLELTQTLRDAHIGAVWCMEFSRKGDYLATAGQDNVLRLWTVCGSTSDRRRWDRAQKTSDAAAAMDPSISRGQRRASAAQFSALESDESGFNHQQIGHGAHHGSKYQENGPSVEPPPPASAVINPVAYRELRGHQHGIIDVSWSVGDFVLSASMDQTVCLWHTSRSRCLCMFQHADFVTSVDFHPFQDYLFLTGSFDSRLRLWNILEHRVLDWVQLPELISAATFTPNGKLAVVGLLNGQCVFYRTDGLRLTYMTTIECRNASGKYKKGTKVTGLWYRPLKLHQSGNANHNGSSAAIQESEHSFVKPSQRRAKSSIGSRSSEPPIQKKKGSLSGRKSSLGLSDGVTVSVVDDDDADAVNGTPVRSSSRVFEYDQRRSSTTTKTGKGAAAAAASSSHSTSAIGVESSPSKKSGATSSAMSAAVGLGGEHGSAELLVTTNDSRMRLFNVSNFEMKTKFKGHSNCSTLQISGRWSPDGQLVISGSDDGYVYVWRHNPELVQSFFRSESNRNDAYEYFRPPMKKKQGGSGGSVTPVAMFAPTRTIYYYYRHTNKHHALLHRKKKKVPKLRMDADTSALVGSMSSMMAVGGTSAHQSGRSSVLSMRVTQSDPTPRVRSSSGIISNHDSIGTSGPTTGTSSAVSTIKRDHGTEVATTVMVSADDTSDSNATINSDHTTQIEEHSSSLKSLSMESGMSLSHYGNGQESSSSVQVSNTPMSQSSQPTSTVGLYPPPLMSAEDDLRSSSVTHGTPAVTTSSQGRRSKKKKKKKKSKKDRIPLVSIEGEVLPTRSMKHIILVADNVGTIYVYCNRKMEPSMQAVGSTSAAADGGAGDGRGAMAKETTAEMTTDTGMMTSSTTGTSGSSGSKETRSTSSSVFSKFGKLFRS